MFARRWRLSRRASQRGTLVRWGGLRGFMRPFVQLVYRSPIPMLVLVLNTARSGGVLAGHTYPQKLESFESLARYDSD
jgi:hypothetical protein